MWEKRIVMYFLFAIFFISGAMAQSPDINLSELNEFIPYSYIIEFKEPSILEKEVLLDEQVERIKKQSQILTEQGRESPAKLLSNQASQIEEKKESIIGKHQEVLEEEHEKALRDIRIKLDNKNPTISGKVVYSSKLWLGNVIRRFTGYNIYDYPTEKISEKEYYRVFNGIVLNNVSINELEKINKSTYVSRIYPNMRVKSLMVDSIHLVNASVLWERDSQGERCEDSGKECLTGKGIKIAVIDTGIDYRHPDLGGCFGEGCKVEGGYDFVNRDSDPLDDQGHGTHVAGTISANRKVIKEGAIYITPTLHWEFNNSFVDNIQDIEGKNQGNVTFINEGFGLKGIEFNNGSIRINSDSLNKNSFTISAWVKPMDSKQGGIFEKTIGERVNSQYLLFIENGRYYFRIATPQGIRSISYPLSSHKWEHLAGVYNGSAIKLYQNGILVNSTKAGNILTGLGPAYIGKLGGGIYPLRGKIDEVIFHDRALSQKEIILLSDLQAEKSINSELKIGIKGVAPDSILYAYKVLGADGGGNFEDVISGIERAVDPNNDFNFNDSVDIISMSLGGPGTPDDPVSKAADNAVSKGVIVVVAAGNSGPSKETIGSPGMARKVITVGAINKSYSLAYFSSRGPVLWGGQGLIKPDILAPGVAIYSTTPEGKYEAFSGTSMATPHVAGIAALMKQAHKDWAPEEIKMALKGNAINVESLSPNEQGNGIMNGWASVYSQKPSKVFLSISKKKGDLEISAELPKEFTAENIALYYSEGYGEKEWAEMILEEKDLKKGKLSKSIDAFKLKDGPYAFRIKTREGSSFGQDDAIIFIDNLNISGIGNYEIYRPGEINKIYLNIEALEHTYKDFKNYIIEYSLNNSNLEWKTQGLMLCEPGGEGISYEMVGNDLCERRRGYERFFIWNTSEIASGIYNLRLRVNYTHSQVEEQISYIYFDKDLKEGWPQRIYAGNYSTHAGDIVPIVFDLDKDGDQEIIINKGRNGYDPYMTLVVYHGNGSIYWERTLGEEFLNGSFGTSLNVLPTIGDLDGDKSPDIVVMLADYTKASAEGGRVYAVNATGSIKPGYPITVANDRLPQIVVADLDGDKSDEIIIQTNFLSNSAYPEEIIIISNKSIKNRWNLPYGNLGNDEMVPTIGNFDSDDDLEIVSLRTIGWPPTTDYWQGYTNLLFGRTTTKGAIYVYNLDGSIVEGWPLAMGGPTGFFATPSIGDLDGDGTSEIIASYINYSTGTYVTAYKRNGEIVEGFPFLIELIDLPPYTVKVIRSPEKSFTLNDLDGDRKLEIIFTTSGSYEIGYPVYVLYSNGTLMSGWPNAAEGGAYKNYAPTIADVDGDGNLDILATAGSVFPIARYDPYRDKLNLSLEGGIWAWHLNGTRIMGYPKGLHYNSFAPPTIADVDGDGLMDLIGSSAYDYDLIRMEPKGYGSLHVWETNVTYPLSHEQWGMFRKDAGRTACYECENKDFEGTTQLRESQDVEEEFTIKKGERVKLIFKETVNLTRIKKNPALMNNIILSQNKVSINTERVPELNKSAELTFKDVRVNEPYILYNNQSCPAEICTSQYNSSSRILILNVNHFSTFEVIESPICGDGICQAAIEESCSSCSLDCGECLSIGDSPPSSGRGSRSSSRSGELCIPNEKCTLGACIDEIQVKECRDLNNCEGSLVTQENLGCNIFFEPLSEEIEGDSKQEDTTVLEGWGEIEEKPNMLNYIKIGIAVGIVMLIAIILIIYIKRKQSPSIYQNDAEE